LNEKLCQTKEKSLSVKFFKAISIDAVEDNTIAKTSSEPS